ncbi:IS200/IS605 family transposase [Myxosarcina sp. GI1]|uniref:IS200/IS605 family transposase n=1 Tax=Myxosarcina sp. GI1 TaxID=1541065 RepID=UPI00056C7AB0|nr:IS200/IS605 family transposase [Myxosarcina sp. GI1]
MERYRRTHTTVSDINYHFIWIPRRRKKVLKGEIKKRLNELIHQALSELDCRLISLAIKSDHVHLFVNAPCHLSIPAIMHKIKGMSARYLRKEFDSLKKLPSMWTRSYFVSTARQVSLETIKEYVEAQGKD